MQICTLKKGKLLIDIGLHYFYKDDMVGPAGDNIQTDFFSHKVRQKLLCSRANSLCSRI